MKPVITLSALLLLASGPLLLNAEIYQSTDEEGNTVFSDSPPPGQESKEVKLRPTNTTPPLAKPKPADTAVPEDAVDDEGEKAPNSYKVRIASPVNDTQVPMGQQDVSISVTLEPQLHDDHQLQIYFNGKKHGDAFKGTSMTLTQVYRGSHTIKASVVDKKGKVISSSKSVTIHVQRPSIARPQPRAS